MVKHYDALLLVGLVLFMAAASLVLFFTQNNAIGQTYYGAALGQYRLLAEAPYTDLPYNNEPIEMPFAGRCYREDGNEIVFFTARHQFVDRAVDGCYKAQDGNFYYYDYFCVGDLVNSQAWLRIYPSCSK